VDIGKISFSLHICVLFECTETSDILDQVFLSYVMGRRTPRPTQLSPPLFTHYVRIISTSLHHAHLRSSKERQGIITSDAPTTIQPSHHKSKIDRSVYTHVPYTPWPIPVQPSLPLSSPHTAYSPSHHPTRSYTTRYNADKCSRSTLRFQSVSRPAPRPLTQRVHHPSPC